MIFPLLYEVLAILIPCTLVYVLRLWWLRRKDSKPTEGLFGVIILSVYLALVFSLTGAATLFDVLQRGVSSFDTQVFFTFFSDPLSYEQNVLNVFLFVPLGVLLPIIWKNLRQFRYVALSGFTLTLIIELSQMLNYRVTDFDDLCMNLLGTVLGYGVFRCIEIIKKKEKPAAKEQLIPVLYIAVAFLGRFFLFNQYMFFGIIQ